MYEVHVEHGAHEEPTEFNAALHFRANRNLMYGTRKFPVSQPRHRSAAKHLPQIHERSLVFPVVHLQPNAICAIVIDFELSVVWLFGAGARGMYLSQGAFFKGS